MKITDIKQGSDTVRYVNQANQQEKNGPAQDIRNKEASMDKVELSLQSKELGKKINDVLEMTPEVRSDRVADLKTAIQEGRYNVDSEVVAEKMLRESIIDVLT